MLWWLVPIAILLAISVGLVAEGFRRSAIVRGVGLDRMSDPVAIPWLIGGLLLFLTAVAGLAALTFIR